MDPVILAGMIFSIIVLLLVGGFVLLLPVSQRLGKVLDIWISEHKSLPGRADDFAATNRALESLSHRLTELEEQQGFLEELVSKKGELPPAEGVVEER